MRRRAGFGLALLVGAAAFLPARLLASEKSRKEVTARGRVVCLARNDVPLGSGVDCDPQASGFDRFGLSTAEGTVYSFMRSDPRAEMFTDPRIRARELEVTGWLTEGGRLEITRILSLVDGKLHDLYYFCSVCDIKSNSPGPCWCCRADFELKEEPHPNH
jgi:hypothetical protein